jgi:hypothetical protein
MDSTVNLYNRALCERDWQSKSAMIKPTLQTWSAWQETHHHTDAQIDELHFKAPPRWLSFFFQPCTIALSGLACESVPFDCGIH